VSAARHGRTAQGHASHGTLKAGRSGLYDARRGRSRIAASATSAPSRPEPIERFATFSTKISIVGVGGMANFVATVRRRTARGSWSRRPDVSIEIYQLLGRRVADKTRRHPLRGRKHDVVEAFSTTTRTASWVFRIRAAPSDHRIGIRTATAPATGCRTTSSSTTSPRDHRRQLLHDADNGHQFKSRAQSRPSPIRGSMTAPATAASASTCPRRASRASATNVTSRRQLPTRRSSTMAARARPMPLQHQHLRQCGGETSC